MSKDNVTPFPVAVQQQASPNDEIIARMKGAEAWSATPTLRWNNGILEQEYIGSSGARKWEPVPDAKDMPY